VDCAVTDTIRAQITNCLVKASAAVQPAESVDSMVPMTATEKSC
jgi:hypothetical protein